MVLTPQLHGGRTTHDEEVALAQELTGALEAGEMELHFQPEIDLATGAVTAMEALLRWAHPGRGLLWPADFLPVADAAGLTPTLGAWVLQRAPGEARHFSAGTRIWINACAAELADPRYPGRVRQSLADLGTPPGGIGIDLPAQALQHLCGGAPAVTGELRGVGAALSVEYDGTTPEVLTRLTELGVETVKLGHALVRTIDTSAQQQEAVGRLVETAAAGRASVTASGVESWAEATMLQRLGVTRAHGFLLAPPMRADRIRWALGRGSSRPSGPSGQPGESTQVATPLGAGADGSGWLTSTRYAAALADGGTAARWAVPTGS